MLPLTPLASGVTGGSKRDLAGSGVSGIVLSGKHWPTWLGLVSDTYTGEVQLTPCHSCQQPATEWAPLG